MKLTRRGYGVLGVAAAAMLLSLHAGPRALNAVAAPALVVLGYGIVHLARRDPPTVTRREPTPGFPGDVQFVELRVDGGPCEVTDDVPSGLRRLGDGPEFVDGDATYSVELLGRGDHHLGPATVVQRDTLGLVERETLATETTTLLVYPTVEALSPNRTFRGLVERTGTADRNAFDTLREYVPGDALRDVHWASSAKRQPGDLVVAEFAREDEGGLTIAAEGDGGFADEMASAAASIALHVLDVDLAVAVSAPGGRTGKRRGESHREDLLELLARTPAGRVTDDDADIWIRADEKGVRVTANGRTFPFDELVDGGTPTDSRPRPKVVP